ncbi:hypothetical protein GCM10029964_056440 [Kibdelosporangium lantanae]
MRCDEAAVATAQFAGDPRGVQKHLTGGGEPAVQADLVRLGPLGVECDVPAVAWIRAPWQRIPPDTRASTMDTRPSAWHPATSRSIPTRAPFTTSAGPWALANLAPVRSTLPSIRAASRATSP